MADKSASPDGQSTPPDSAAPPAPPIPPKRGPGHRGVEVKDTVAEMAAKAHEISLEAGSKMAAAMKDVINAAAGLTGFVLESARDLVQYMVRRGQMTQEEADKLIRQAEEAQTGSPPRPQPAPAAKSAATPALTVKAILADQPVTLHSARPSEGGTPTPANVEPENVKRATAEKHPVVAKKAAAKALDKPTAKKSAAKTAEKPAAKKATIKRK